MHAAMETTHTILKELPLTQCPGQVSWLLIEITVAQDYEAMNIYPPIPSYIKFTRV